MVFKSLNKTKTLTLERRLNGVYEVSPHTEDGPIEDRNTN